MTLVLLTAAIAAPAPEGLQSRLSSLAENPLQFCDTHCRLHIRLAGRLWQHRYAHLSRTVKAKLRRMAWCESRDRPSAHSGPHHGRFQYVLSTARAAGYRRDPHTLRGREGRAQDYVRTYRWARRAGWGQWPVCGR